MTRNILRAIACAGAGLWLTLASALAGDALGQSARSAAEIMDILMWNREPVGGPFALTDQAGHARTDEEFRGKLMLVYFGFTYCPDVCPTDLQAIALTLDKLGPDGDQVQPIFITVDPERDTAAHLAEYVPLFHPRLIGLTGSFEAIRQLADAYKVYYARVPLKDDDYTVDHTAYIYLMDRDGNYLGFFPPGTSADRMVEIIRPRLAEPAR
ncbi:SCO family protein [Bradyrhizobium septentrionale]|uniref:SCO family protein n=1 Tax=Bradyrhizobium septentrionale TaxID=1404411 RepID=A0A973W877_9BRAD|nr:SCO family protein [Bradyrhizobium septentrionale]UGY17532.1 SCO family protein [Bradyrhizobium septentrionale]UGY26269.1 SCO family protein [Bradyrhizobium septentrionale]